jgi:hypothetical protein
MTPPKEKKKDDDTIDVVSGIFDPYSVPENQTDSILSTVAEIVDSKGDDEIFISGKVPDKLTRREGEKTIKSLVQHRPLFDYLQKNHTFIHAKVGFYQTILQHIYPVLDENNNARVTYIHNKVSFIKYLLEQELSPLPATIPLVLLPTEKNDELVNAFVSEALDSNQIIWLIAHPKSIRKHLLTPFHNFFIASSSNEDIAYVRDIINISEADKRLLTSETRRGSLFATDYYPAKGTLLHSNSLRFG